MLKQIIGLSLLMQLAFFPDQAGANDGALARCGASLGLSYFFGEDTGPQKDSPWVEDGISGGKLVLINLGDEWDIQFGDVAGSYGYRQDGAVVVPLAKSSGMFTVGAFTDNYVDVFTFDFSGEEVVWSSHKTGTPFPKVGVYRAACSFLSPRFFQD